VEQLNADWLSQLNVGRIFEVVEIFKLDENRAKQKYSRHSRRPAKIRVNRNHSRLDSQLDSVHI